MNKSIAFPLATLLIVLTQSAFQIAAAQPLPTSAYGSGVPLYGLSDDLVNNGGAWSSKSWLSQIINPNHSGANLRYIYPNYPYINFLAFDDPDNWKAYPTSDLYSTDCSNSLNPIFIDYNVMKPNVTTPGSSCWVSGTTANQVYRNNGVYRIMPQFSMDSTLASAIKTCYTNLANKQSCTLPCGSSSGANKVFNLPTNQCTNGQTTIVSTQRLDNMMMYTGKLIANLINSDMNADGVSFDIEGPALPDEAALNFYKGLMGRLYPSKYVGVWEGVDVFKNTTLQDQLWSWLKNYNAFIIVSMYDIGPDDQPGDGGGLEVGQPPAWYSAAQVQQSLAPSKLSAFELTLFGLNDGTYACHPTSMKLDTASTGFNGCTGSLGFMNRMMNNTTGMAFQVGIPAISSTTEWVNAVMWYDQNTGVKPANQEIMTSDAAQQWITNTLTTCPSNLSFQVSGRNMNCYVYQIKNGQTNTQAQFLTNNGGTDGLLNIITNRLKNDNIPQWQQYFMGFYIYGIKDTNFDRTNCNAYFVNTGASAPVCYGNYPETVGGSYTNTIQPNVWAAISNFQKTYAKNMNQKINAKHKSNSKKTP